MLTIDKDTNKITIVRKDTGDITLSLENYILDTGDRVTFTINSDVELETPLVQKVYTEFTDGSCIIRLTSEDTNLPIGTYVYDIQINTADGRVDTIVGPAKLKIVGGVTY